MLCKKYSPSCIFNTDIKNISWQQAVLEGSYSDPSQFKHDRKLFKQYFLSSKRHSFATLVKHLFCSLTRSVLGEITIQHFAGPLVKERMQDVKKLVLGTIPTEKCHSPVTEARKLSRVLLLPPMLCFGLHGAFHWEDKTKIVNKIGPILYPSEFTF